LKIIEACLLLSKKIAHEGLFMALRQNVVSSRFSQVVDRSVRTNGGPLGFGFPARTRQNVRVLRERIKVQVRDNGRRGCTGASGYAEEERQDMQQVNARARARCGMTARRNDECVSQANGILLERDILPDLPARGLLLLY